MTWCWKLNKAFDVSREGRESGCLSDLFHGLGFLVASRSSPTLYLPSHSHPLSFHDSFPAAPSLLLTNPVGQLVGVPGPSTVPIRALSSPTFHSRVEARKYEFSDPGWSGEILCPLLASVSLLIKWADWFRSGLITRFLGWLSGKLRCV